LRPFSDSTNGSWTPDHIAVALAWVGLAVLLYLVFLVAQPFLNPLGWAGVIAVVFYPSYARLERRWGASRAAAISTVAVAVIVIGPLLLVVTAFVREALDALRDLQGAFTQNRFGWVERAWSAVAERVPGEQRADFAAVVGDVTRRAALFLAAQSGSMLRNAAGFVFDLTLALFATFFLLRDSSIIMAAIRRLLPMNERNRERLIQQTRELVSMSVTSAGIVAAVQGLLGGLVFWAVGIDAPVFWGVVMAFFCLLPLGAWVIWLPAAVLLWAGGSPGRALVVAGLGVGIVSAVDNVLRPVLLSGTVRMNGLLIFISLLGGIGAFGALGLVLGPILMATAMAIVMAYVQSDPDVPNQPMNLAGDSGRTQ
jgi:predicted PurR-regulated permease PerM